MIADSDALVGDNFDQDPARDSIRNILFSDQDVLCGTNLQAKKKSSLHKVHHYPPFLRDTVSMAFKRNTSIINMTHFPI